MEAQRKTEVEYDDGDDTASDSWSDFDSDDDDDHALVRTQSGRLQRVEEDQSSDDEEIFGIIPSLTKSGETTVESSPETIVDGEGDYFNHRSTSVTFADNQFGKQREGGDAEIVSPLSPGS